MQVKEIEMNALDEMNKGVCMGKDAIEDLLNKVRGKELEEEMKHLKQKYEEIERKISILYPSYSWDSPHKTTSLNKFMTWYGIEMKTFMDERDSKIAELLVEGLNMGIIEGRKLLNHKNCESQVQLLIHEYVSMQEEAIETFKNFL